MKIRNGFVSNSSSSSFLVDIISWNNIFSSRTTPVFSRSITAAQEKKLLKHGYKRTPVNSPSDLESVRQWCDDKWIDESPKTAQQKPGFLPKNSDEYFDTCKYLGYGITCNQDDEIEWLVKNKIPFRASIHYGHSTVVFNGKTVYEFDNPGVRNEFCLDFDPGEEKKLIKSGILKKVVVKKGVRFETLM